MSDVCLLRKGMIGELETINTYKKLLDEATDAKTKKLFESIIEEEMVHVGEFQYLINYYCDLNRAKVAEGEEEARAMYMESMLP